MASHLSRLVGAAALCLPLASPPALAALDAYTQWLQSQPLTHLDWIVFDAREELEKAFGAPVDEYPSVSGTRSRPRSAFEA